MKKYIIWGVICASVMIMGMVYGMWMHRVNTVAQSEDSSEFYKGTVEEVNPSEGSNQSVNTDNDTAREESSAAESETDSGASPGEANRVNRDNTSKAANKEVNKPPSNNDKPYQAVADAIGEGEVSKLPDPNEYKPNTEVKSTDESHKDNSDRHTQKPGSPRSSSSGGSSSNRGSSSEHSDKPDLPGKREADKTTPDKTVPEIKQPDSDIPEHEKPDNQVPHSPDKNIPNDKKPDSHPKPLTYELMLLNEHTRADGSVVLRSNSMILPRSSIIGYRSTGENSGEELNISWSGDDLPRVTGGTTGKYNLIATVDESFKINDKEYNNVHIPVQIIIE